MTAAVHEQDTEPARMEAGMVMLCTPHDNEGVESHTPNRALRAWSKASPREPPALHKHSMRAAPCGSCAARHPQPRLNCLPCASGCVEVEDERFRGPRGRGGWPGHWGYSLPLHL